MKRVTPLSVVLLMLAVLNLGLPLLKIKKVPSEKETASFVPEVPTEKVVVDVAPVVPSPCPVPAFVPAPLPAFPPEPEKEVELVNIPEVVVPPVVKESETPLVTEIASISPTTGGTNLKASDAPPDITLRTPEAAPKAPVKVAASKTAPKKRAPKPYAEAQPAATPVKKLPTLKDVGRLLFGKTSK